MELSKSFRAMLLGVSLAIFCVAPAHAGDEDEPTAMAMAGDLLIARPGGLVLTVVGAAAFVVSLPFSAAGGNVGKAADQLVVGPAKTTFLRCLGCKTNGRYQDPDRR